MNIEDKIKKMVSNEDSSLNTEIFLDNLHSTRAKRTRRTKRITYGVSSLVVVLLVSVLSISQLRTNEKNTVLYSGLEVTDEELEEYYDDMMVYLVEESDDVWSAMEFFYENEDEIEN